MADKFPTGEPGWFWIPDEVVNLHLCKIGVKAFAVYCCLASCEAAREYPPIHAMAKMTTLTPTEVKGCLRRLLNAKLITNKDHEYVMKISALQIPT